MTDLNAPLDPTERDALAWRMLEERLELSAVDLDTLHSTPNDIGGGFNATDCVRRVFRAVHDALAYRRQT